VPKDAAQSQTYDRPRRRAQRDQACPDVRRLSRQCSQIGASGLLSSSWSARDALQSRCKALPEACESDSQLRRRTSSTSQANRPFRPSWFRPLRSSLLCFCCRALNSATLCR
jgi:hypothetical protein